MYVLSRADTFGVKWKFSDNSYSNQVSNLDGVVFANHYRSQVPVARAVKKMPFLILTWSNLRYGLVG